MLCFRLFSENNPAVPLADAVAQLREGQAPKDLYAVEPASFQQIPNAPFAYWVSERIRRLFVELPAFDSGGRQARLGASTKNDFRFLRLVWELKSSADSRKEWALHAKGGSYSKYYSDLYLAIKWGSNAREIEAELLQKYPYLGNDAEFVLHRDYPHMHPGLTWPRRANGLSFRALPAGSVFGDKGPAAFVSDDATSTLASVIALANSTPFLVLISAQVARVELAQSWEVGLIQSTPLPATVSKKATKEFHHAWAIKHGIDASTLTSNAFYSPALAPSRFYTKHSRA
jgi:hypothetical protein